MTNGNKYCFKTFGFYLLLTSSIFFYLLNKKPLAEKTARGFLLTPTACALWLSFRQAEECFLFEGLIALGGEASFCYAVEHA